MPTGKPSPNTIPLAPTLAALPTPPPNQTGWPWTEERKRPSETRPDGSPWPKISVVTPSYNQGPFIEKTIRSVLLQGYPNLEYIVMDGGSTDDSVETIEKYAPWLDYWESRPDRGQAHAINKGFERATGEIFAWLNSDDFYLPGTLERVATEFARRDDRVGALVGDGEKVRPTGEVVARPPVQALDFETLIDWHNANFMQPSCFFRASAWQRCGPLREDLTYCFDVDLWLKIAQQFDMEHVAQLLSRATVHPAAKTTAEMPQARVETAFLVIEYGRSDLAKRSLMDMADRYARLNHRRHNVQSHPVYKLARPFLRVARRILIGSR